MRHDFLDRFSRLDSPIHRLPAMLKGVIALCCILTVVLSPILWIYPFIVVALLLVLVIVASKVPILFLIKRVLLFEPFVILVALLSLLQPDGVQKFSSIIVKSTLSLITVIMISNTTPFSELLKVLRRIHAPAVMVSIIALMYRYIFVLVDEMERMKRARQSRTFGKSRFHAWYFLSTVIGQLFLRSTERAERIFAAMSARGWK